MQRVHMAPSTPFQRSSTLPTVVSLARISRGEGVGAQSVEGTVSFLLNDARHLWQPSSRQARYPREWQGFSEGPKLLVSRPLWSPA